MIFVRKLLLIGLLVVFVIPVAAQSDVDMERIQRATVLIYQATEQPDGLVVTCVGSGTLVSRDGFILTNAHHVSPNPSCIGNVLIVAMSVILGEAPVPTYRASLVQVDEGLDIALLRITRDVDGRLLDPDALSLPFVEVADSDQLALDDTVTVVGYPSLGDSPIITDRGVITSFLEESVVIGRSWIKVSVSVPGIVSGGGAYNSAGQLIGIPTVSTFSPDPISDQSCRFLQDVDGNLLIDAADTCIPIGPDTNLLRPSNFARPLLRSSILGLSIATDAGTSTAENAATSAAVSRLFFALAVNDAGLPSGVVNSAPTGATSLYLFFDYMGISEDTIFELRVTRDNIPNPILSLPPVRWSGEQRGLWYIGSSGQVWPNGVYDFTIFINGIAQQTASIVIGGAPEVTPAMSDIVFGLSDLDGTPIGNGFVLPVGNVASARFIYRNMENGMEWIARWFYEGNEVFRTDRADLWSDGPNGAKTISIQEPNGLLPGKYRLELYIAGRLAATSDFIIAGQRQGAFPEVFQNPRFVAAASTSEALEAPVGTSFSSDIEQLYLLFDWQQIASGTTWRIRWRVDETIFYDEILSWSGQTNGNNYAIPLSSPDGIPDGTYRVDLFIAQVQLASIEAAVGIGQLPIDRFAQTSGLQLQGYIRDYDTRQGIPGVTFILITEDFSVADFVWDSEQVYDTGTTDRNGFFSLDRLLEISDDNTTIPYSVIVNAEGYLTVAADGFVVTNETDNPLTLTIYLRKG